MGVHPAEEPGDAGDHDVSFYCDDIHGTVADLRSRGVAFTKDVEDHGYGLVTYFTVPGGVTVQLYEPRYRKSPSARRPAKAKPKRRAAKRASKKRR